ncbi:Toxin RelE2 [Candidatus Brocadiaceae bacterium B188]|nr:type II toxin-antitoxin system RelE/ParE family toxin [Candidatus Brocadia sapporoensis]QQR65653.1 MAG: type II toxin-antitoxin system RelE/ParE family toxin [Candidatus Brocadia sp.]RZV59846.1 MAG: type II toxin-antitoxin system RelE/ParE family toxin [Candidatus Brocadia sp. BROELEC01]TWU49965.1 Toxin RelE2 [Candidatus Brocadiaceae bacterium B188]
MRLHWTDTAIEQLSAIHAYYKQNSPTYAQRIVDRLTRRSQQIINFPLSGRIVPEMNIPQIREVVEGPYRIIYYIKTDQIDVLAVIHGSQQILWDK